METCLTIYVTFEGLGICCFNPKQKGAEIAFLRLADHDLKITISGSDGRHQVFDTIPDSVKIELTSQGSAAEKFELNTGGKFERQKGLGAENDRFDLRWLLDLENAELHGKKARMRPKPTAQTTAQTDTNAGSVRALTEMFLPNAYFFTEQILAPEYEIEQINTATGEKSTKPFGLIGGALGARGDAASSSLRINEKDVFRFGGGSNPEQVTRFFVTITNVCKAPPTAEPRSDFRKYYEVLDFEDGREFDFDLLQKDFRSRRPAICEIVWLSKTETLSENVAKPEA